MTDPNTIVASGVAVAQAAGAAIPDTVRQVDKFGTDVSKTIRLLLFPPQNVLPYFPSADLADCIKLSQI